MVKDETTVETLDRLHTAYTEKSLRLWTPDELSRCMVEISAYMVNLGQMVADVINDRDDALFDYENKRNQVYEDLIDSEESASNAKVLCELAPEVKILKNLYRQKKRTYTTLKHFYDDLERVVTTIQSRLSQIRSEQSRLPSEI